MPVPTKSGPGPRSVKAVQTEPKRLSMKGFVKQTKRFTSGVKGQGSDRWWERKQGIWWIDARNRRKQHRKDS